MAVTTTGRVTCSSKGFDDQFGSAAGDQPDAEPPQRSFGVENGSAVDLSQEHGAAAPGGMPVG